VVAIDFIIGLQKVVVERQQPPHSIAFIGTVPAADLAVMVVGRNHLVVCWPSSFAD